MTWFTDLIRNPFFITSVSSWAIAQVLKVIINFIVTKELRWERLFGDGGMPSGHSATVSSLAMFSALVYGTGSFQFAVCGILAIIVCHDAMGVRLETGKQAIVLNELLGLALAHELAGSGKQHITAGGAFVGLYKKTCQN